MYRRVLGAALLVSAASASPALAEQTPLGVSSDRVDVVMTSDGAAHVAYLDGTSLKVCRIAAGSSACEAKGDSGPLPGSNTIGSPFILTDGTAVTAVIRRDAGSSGRTFAMRSATGNGFYTGLAPIADVNAVDAALSADGTRILLLSEDDPGPANTTYLAVTSAPLPPSSTTAAAVLGAQPQVASKNLSGFQLALQPDGRPLALMDGYADGSLANGRHLYRFTGAPADPLEVNDSSKWTVPPGSYAPPAGFEQNGGGDLAGGSGALWFAYAGLTPDVLLRKWDPATTSFGTPVRPDCVDRRYGSGVQGPPALAVAPGGDTLTAFAISDGTNSHLAYIRGNADGTAFSPYQELVTPAPGIDDLEIAADPDPARSVGVVVWTDESNGGGPVRFTRLPATTFAACPPAAAAPPSGTPPVATPPVVVKPPVVKKPKAPKLSTVVSGLPSAARCVSKRRIKLHLKQPKGLRIRKGTIAVNGKTKATRKGRKVTSTVDLRGLPKGRYTVKITLKLSDGRTVKYTRKYRTCTPGTGRKRKKG